jgi:hypothetical protein
MKYPMQSIIRDSEGALRFQSNRIVRALLDKATAAGLMDMNSIARDAANDLYTKEERQQFAQLIGYSLDGYAELTDYVDGAAWQRANREKIKFHATESA